MDILRGNRVFLGSRSRLYRACAKSRNPVFTLKAKSVCILLATRRPFSNHSGLHFARNVSAPKFLSRCHCHPARASTPLLEVQPQPASLFPLFSRLIKGIISPPPPSFLPPHSLSLSLPPPFHCSSLVSHFLLITFFFTLTC